MCGKWRQVSSMKCRVKYMFVILGLLGSSLAAPDRVKREESDADRASRLCQQIFGVSCLSVNPTLSSVLPPPLSTDLPNVVEPDCTCVPYYRCSPQKKTAPSTTTIYPGPFGTTVSPVTFGPSGNTNPGTTPDLVIFDIGERFGEPCSETLDVCCSRSSIISDTEATVPTPTLPPLNSQRTGCGYRNPNGLLVRITGNADRAQLAEFPWMVVVLKKFPTGSASNYQCGGSLIHPRVVLTTAHNVVNYATRPWDLVVRAGEWDAATRSEPIAHQQRDVETVILHEQFVRRPLVNDFALLILNDVFDSAPNVNTICLPEESDVFDAARCIATGWGQDSFGSEGRFQAILKKVELPVVPHDACENSLRLTQPGRIFNLDQSFICAGGEPGKDTCMGDGGSPLVCPLPNAEDRYVQAGIVSWGVGCGRNRVPGVYSSVSKARRWIDSKMALYNFETTCYIA